MFKQEKKLYLKFEMETWLQLMTFFSTAVAAQLLNDVFLSKCAPKSYVPIFLFSLPVKIASFSAS